MKAREIVHRFGHEAMATAMEFFAAGVSAEYASQAARAVFEEIDRVERLFSRFDPSSEISRTSRLRPGEPMRIGLESYECLNLAFQLREDTRGAFDINFRAHLNVKPKSPAKKRGKPGTRSASGSPIPAGLRFPVRRPDDVLFLRRLPDGFEAARPPSVSGKKPIPFDLDLGGIGKGFALDKAIEVLTDWDIPNVLLQAGTSTALARGSAPGVRPPGWPVGVGGVWACPGLAHKLFLRGRALSGSGTEVKGAHILDSRSGLPARGHLAAWASHPSATVSDALSTAFMVMGTEEVAAFCASRPEVWALVISGPKSCKIFNGAAVENE